MAPSDETDPDYQSRLNVSLETGSVPYDEVIAFTEHILNKNFDSMFEMHKDDMKDIVFNDADAGLVNVEIEAPRLIIPGSKDQAYGKNVFYMLRFKSGYVETATGLSRKMDGWELAIPTVLNTEDVEPDKTLYKEIQLDEKTHKAVSVAGTIYKFPGDYSIERLFAQLTTARWSEPDHDLSLITDEKGNPMTITDYCKTPSGSKIWALLSTVLADWGQQQHLAGRSTLNVTFNLPEKRFNVEKPTYAPTDLYQQTYPYKCPQKGIKVPKTSRTGEGFNALLWCEMVAGNQPPTTKQLEWRGNYVIPERPYKGGDAIEGTFALSYKHFLEGHLLKRLQRLNQVSQVANLEVKRWYKDSEKMFMTDWNYEMGNYNLKHLNDAFKFDRYRTNSDNDDSIVTYEWNHEEKIPEADRYYTWDGHGGTCSTTEHYATTKVTLSWKNGSSVFDVKGHTDYVYDNILFPNSNRVPADKFSQLRYHYVLDWQLEIVITGIKDGKMSIDVRTPEGPQPREVANLTVVQKTLLNDRSWVPPNQENIIRQQWLDRMKTCMADIEKDVEQEFESTAKFVYPGNGDLNFSKPVISRFGNILAVVEHKPLDPKALTEGKYITVQPALKIPKIVQPIYTPLSNKQSQGTPKPVVKLSWTMDRTSAVAKKKGLKFVLTGKNETSDPFGLSYIWIRFSSGEEGPQLFRHEVINGVKSPYYKEPPPPSPPPAASSKGGGTKSKTKGSKTLLGDLYSKFTGKNDNEEEAPTATPSGDEKIEGEKAPTRTTENPQETGQPMATDIITIPTTGTKEIPKDPLESGDVEAVAPVTDPEAELKPVQPVGATITMTSSSPSTMNLLPIQVNFWKPTEDGQHWWQLTVKPEKKFSGFVVKPGESITVEMTGMDIGLSGTYMVTVRENWVVLPELKKLASPPNSDDFVIEVGVSAF